MVPDYLITIWSINTYRLSVPALLQPAKRFGR
jgi:hypothetical protein